MISPAACSRGVASRYRERQEVAIRYLGHFAAIAAKHSHPGNRVSPLGWRNATPGAKRAGSCVQSFFRQAAKPQRRAISSVSFEVATAGQQTPAAVH